MATQQQAQQQTEATEPPDPEAWRKDFRAARIVELERVEEVRRANAQQRLELQAQMDALEETRRLNYERTKHCASSDCQADRFDKLPAAVQFQRQADGGYREIEVEPPQFRCVGCGSVWGLQDLI